MSVSAYAIPAIDARPSTHCIEFRDLTVGSTFPRLLQTLCCHTNFQITGATPSPVHRRTEAWLGEGKSLPDNRVVVLWVVSVLILAVILVRVTFTLWNGV